MRGGRDGGETVTRCGLRGEELVAHVKQATGQKLPVAVETAIPSGYASRVFVGVGGRRKKQGIEAEKLPIEEYVLRTVGPDLYIVGKELRPGEYHGTRPLYSEPWNPLAMECVQSGTLLGVYEILENDLGVRWLWPGELGTYVPRQSAVVLAARKRGSNRGWFIATWGVGTCRRFI